MAVEGNEPSGLPKSGVPLLAQNLRQKMGEDIKAKELAQEARAIRNDGNAVASMIVIMPYPAAAS